ncbi:ABC transporter permease [Cohnella cellulosilytica]|uniref:ABC transporter permease n=2 Tax=Cohnella cellulosilytica TaxID=986710 RepID=A0ABW2FJ52_9BACL
MMNSTKQKWNLRRTWPLHSMVLPGLLVLLVFQYGPMPGIIMAFQDFKPYAGFTGSEWIGLDHFREIAAFSDTKQVIWNTFVIASLKIVFQLATPFVFALMLNEVAKTAFKRTVQTLVYLPHFMSWVILGGILLDILNPEGGLVTRVMVDGLGMKPVFFLGDGDWFRFVVVASDVWKEFGFGTIVFLAALAGINGELYEAAVMDGANRWKQLLHITIPLLLPMAIVVGTLSLGNILNAGFDQIFNLYNPLVYDKGDIIDTYVYRMALLNGQFSFATAVGLFKSVISFILIVIAYRLAYKFADYRIF